MYLERFYDDKLAQASYLVGCQATGEAIVIDPSREVERYIQAAKNQNLTIVGVTETHIHADFLSGCRQMAHQTGATMYLSKDGGSDWQYQFATSKDKLVSDGDIITIGNLSLKVFHTPGHTPEHICFLLTDHPMSDKPIGLFSGDLVFVGDVGRPDLLEKAAGIQDTMRLGAAQLYNSIQRIKELPDHIQIWPGHGAGSACGKALGAVPSSVLGYEKICNWALKCTTEDEFIDIILDGQPEPPKYFAQMKMLNRLGPAILEPLAVPHLGSSKLAEVQQNENLLDLRGLESFVESHPKNAIFLPSGNAFTTWAGWLLDYSEDIYVLLNSRTQLPEVATGLRAIGLDNLKGYFLAQDLNDAIEMQSSERIEAEDVGLQEQSVIDVRSAKEWKAGHFKEACHIHLGYLLERMDEVPEHPVVHCQSGVRSLIASSLLQRAGKDPVDVIGGYLAMVSRREVVRS